MSEHHDAESRSSCTDSTEEAAAKTETLNVQRHPSRTLLIVVAVAAAAIVLLIVVLLWPKQKTQIAAGETPPALATGKEGSEDEHSQEATIEISDKTAELAGVKTEPAARGEIEDTISSTGKVLVAPDSEAIVGAKVSGRAVRVQAEPGQAVAAGQVVVVVDSPQIAELRGQLVEARSRLQLAEQNRARAGRSENRVAALQARNRLDLAQTVLDRKRRLAAIGAAAQREVNEAETEFKNAKAEYDYQSNIQVSRQQQEALSEVEQARATVTRLSQQLAALGAGSAGQGGLINISSPIAGTVVDRHISVGGTVSENTELMTVMNLGNVIVEAQLPESQAGHVRIGQRMIARIPGAPDRAFEGYVQSVGETVDPRSRTVAVRARVANPGATLKHEMGVEIRIVTGGRKGALMIPAAALVDDEGVKVIYVKEGTKYERREVSVGNLTFQWAEILSGVAAGEQVVVAGAYQLRNMQKGGGGEGGDHEDH